MAHNIATIKGKKAMAYIGETPWHRLGTEMFGFPDVDAALKAASQDWQVELQPVFLAGPKKTLGVQVPRCRAVVRDVDQQILSTVGDVYEPLQNREAFSVLDVACQEHGVHIETAGALGIGDRVWMLARLPNSIEPVKGDKVNGYVLITTGHNGWTAYEGRLTMIRVVCNNTLTAAVSSNPAFVKLRHVRSQTDQLKQVENLVTNLVASLKETGVNFSKLAAKRLTLTEINAYIDAVLKVPQTEVVKASVKVRRDAVLELATGKALGSEYAPMSAWTAYNAVTEYVDHVIRKNAKAALRQQQADTGALFGTGLKLKEKALEHALELVK